MYVDTQAFIDDYTDDAKRLIRKAHALLKRNGWVQGIYDGNDGSHCLIGALRAATDDEGPVELRAVQLLGAAIGVVTTGDRLALTHRIEMWNDDTFRTKREVLAVMKKAAMK